MRKTTLIPMLLLLLSGCANAVSDSGVCAGIDRAVTEHAAALAQDAGPQSLRTGDRLVRMIDAGCGA